MANEDNVIEDDVVRISPDLTGFKRKLLADLKKEMSGVQATVKVRLVADKTGFARSVREQLRAVNLPEVKVRVVADTRGFGRSLKGIRGATVTLKAETDSGQVDRELDKLYKRVRDNEEKVEQAEDQAYSHRFRRSRSFWEAVARDELAAYRESARLQKAELDKQAGEVERAASQRNRVLEQEARDARRIAERSTREAQRQQLARRKSLFTGTKLIDYGGEGIRPTNLLLGVVTAMTPALFAMGSSALQASTGIAALGSAGIGAAFGLGALVVAFQGIGDVLSLRQQVLDEATAAAAKAGDTTRDLANAKRDLADAQRDEKTANADIHKQRREAIRDLADLKQSVIDLNNQYRSDALSVAEAKENEAATHRNFFATALEKRRATQDRRDAETKFSDTRLERKQKTEDLQQSLRKGIEGSDKVRDAKERARDARDRTLDAQDRLSKASGGVDKTSSAAARLKAKLAELSPAAREMYYWFEKNDALFKRLRNTIAQKTLPGFNDFLKAVAAKPKGGGKSTLELAAQYAGELGAIIGKYVGAIGKFTRSPLFRESMARIQARNAAAFDSIGGSLVKLLKPLLRIVDVAGPGFTSMADSFERFVTWFDEVIAKASKDGSLKQWFADSRREAGKWFDIAGNILTILSNLFRASLPAGGSLVEQFRIFTQNLADLTSSPEGMKSIKGFFDTIANLPFAKIIDFFIAATEFFVFFRTAKFLLGLNPFFTAFAAFAASNPGLAASAIGVLTDKIRTVAAFLVAHPEAVTGLLAILAAAKIGKAIGFNVTVPAVTALRDALTSKFKVLDKFVGGGANTATMTVHAGVVNIIGKAGTGTVPPVVGTDGKPAKPGKPGKTSRVSGAASTLGTGNIVIAAALAGYTIGMDEIDRVKSILNGKNTEAYHSWADAITKKPFDWDNWYQTFVDNSLVTILPLLANKLVSSEVKNSSVPDFSVKPRMLEANALNRLQDDVRDTGGIDNPVAQASLKTYIANRKTAVDAYVRWVKSNQGPIAAARAEKEENAKSRKVLADLLVQYGKTETEAKKYADKAFSAGEESAKAATKVKDLNSKLGTLSTRLNEVTGKKQIILTISGQEKVFGDLASAAAYQQIVKRGLDPTQSNLNKFKRQIYDKNTGGGTPGGVAPTPPKQRSGGGGSFADGGRVTGYSPNPRADNIPAMLTADEYVQPVAAVKHYGTDFMEAIRTRRLPKFAAGGLVGGQSWPFTVKMPDALAAVQTAYSGAGGIASGNVNVAETAEATARAMGATEKQLVALIEAGLVESGLRNLNYGDRDSVGFLQQRASWGSTAARMDVATATRKFINKARRIKDKGLTAGQLAQAVQVSAFPDRYDQRQADAIAVINRALPYMRGFEPSTTSGISGGGAGTKAGLIAFGRWLQQAGYSVSEHPAFGGVDGVHVDRSQHYRASAIDVNRGGGTSAREQAYLRRILPEAHRRGFRSIFMSPGHYNHAHFDLGQGHADGGQVRKYDTGGTLPPGYTMAFNGTGKNETIRTAEQEKNLNAPVRIDRRDLAQLAALFGGGSAAAVNMDGRKVAELTNRYNYLPAGV